MLEKPIAITPGEPAGIGPEITLKAWKDKNAPNDDDRAWIAKSGITVHFKTPIKGDVKNGFVQTDLMFGEPELMKFAMKGSGDENCSKKISSR